jgi:hypothetical protein
MSSSEPIKGFWGGVIQWADGTPPDEIGAEFTLDVTSVSGTSFEGQFLNSSGEPLAMTDKTASPTNLTIGFDVVTEKDGTYRFVGKENPVDECYPGRRCFFGAVNRVTNLPADDDGQWIALAPPPPPPPPGEDNS